MSYLIHKSLLSNNNITKIINYTSRNFCFRKLGFIWLSICSG